MSAPTAVPHLSVVVATRERPGLLPRLVRALEAQVDCAPFEVVIVDDGSRDDTWSVLERLTSDSPLTLRPLRLPRNRGPATARNLGWRSAQAPLIAFTDDDCVPQPGWIGSLEESLATADIVQGRTLPDPEQESNRGPFSHTMHVKGENGYYATCNIAYRREVLERVGGFDERFRHAYGEDVDLAWRAKETGATTCFARSATVLHDIRPGRLSAHVRDLRRRAGIVDLVAAHPGMRSKLHRSLFVKASHPSALLAGAGLLVAAAGRGPAVRLGGLALIGPYLRHRRQNPLTERTRPIEVPLALGSDLLEIAILAGASSRRRRLVL